MTSPYDYGPIPPPGHDYYNQPAPQQGGGFDWGGFGSAALGALGGIVGGSSARKADSKARRHQVWMMKEQMHFQRMRDNRKYRIAMHDMKAAGLNPILAYGGAGAGQTSAPSGGTPPQAGAVEAARIRSQVGLNTAKITQTLADAALKRAEADLSNARTATETLRPAQTSAQTLNLLKDLNVKTQQIDKIHAEIQTNAAQYSNLMANAQGKRLENVLTTIVVDLYSENPWLYELKDQGLTAKTIVDAVGEVAKALIPTKMVEDVVKTVTSRSGSTIKTHSKRYK